MSSQFIYNVRLNGRHIFSIQATKKQTTKDLTRLMCLILTTCYTKIFGWWDTSAYGLLLKNKQDMVPSQKFKIQRCSSIHAHWQKYIRKRFIVTGNTIFLFDKSSFMAETLAAVQFHRRIKMHDVYILGNASFRNS